MIIKSKQVIPTELIEKYTDWVLTLNTQKNQEVIQLMQRKGLNSYVEVFIFKGGLLRCLT